MILKKIFPPKLRFFFKDALVLSLFILAAFLNVASWLSLMWQINAKHATFFLHYTVYFGVDWTGQWYKIFFVPLVGLLILLGNFIAAFIFYHSRKIISYLLVLAAVFAQVLVLLQSVLLILMNS
ncbi:MAG: hypothetical protein Q8M83_02695 [bacterium]|nr:hypothetical protein [bacterium]